MDFDPNATRESLLQRQPEYIEPFGDAEVADEHIIKVACSLKNMSEQMQATIERLNPVEMVRLGGAGNKAYRIVTGEVDSYVQPRAGLKFWDLCAPEAIVRAMGGVLTLIPEEHSAV